jgi:flavin-dependent dehydrogenase
MKNSIAIIGGNISGLSSAYYLAKKGVQVTVFESKLFNKPCGGAISLEFDQYLRDELSITLDESDHYTERFKVGLWNGRFMEDEGVFRVTTRYDLQTKLIDRLREEPNVDIKVRRVSSCDFDLFTPQTVVATGYSGFTKTIMDRKWERNDKALTLRFDGVVKDTSYPNANLIVLNHGKMGYAWVFVGKDNHVNIGVGAVADREYIWNMYYEFYDIIREKYGYNIDPPATKPQSWVLPMLVNKQKYPVSRIQNEIEFIGVGDAIGLAHSLSGAGIEPAWQSGWILASCLNSNGKVDVIKYRKLIKLNLRLTVWRRMDHLLAVLSRKPIPFKDKIGFLGLHFIRHRMINMMQKYPWFALVHDGIKETGFRIPSPEKYIK